MEAVFTLCGGHISPILVGAEAAGLRVVDTRHEAAAVFAADALARLKQDVGVAAVTAGPGLTNTLTAVKNAQLAESPVLLLGGAAATLLKGSPSLPVLLAAGGCGRCGIGRGALQDIDQMALFRPVCKMTASISRVKDIGPTLCKAIHAARSGVPGPVFVEFPIDTLYPYAVSSTANFFPLHLLVEEMKREEEMKGVGGGEGGVGREYEGEGTGGEACQRLPRLPRLPPLRERLGGAEMGPATAHHTHARPGPGSGRRVGRREPLGGRH